MSEIKKDVIVEAIYVTRSQLAFVCPFCFTNYKKNGEPYKRAKKVTHYHGSEHKLENRTTRRIAHCDPKRLPPNFGEFIIQITDNTKRM